MVNFITVTEAAASKISALMAEENKTSAGLRVFVQGGGCSGFQYGLMIEDGDGDESADRVFESNGVNLYVDPISMRYLSGAEVDFVDNLTLEELALVFSTAETWADVNPDWPAEPIQRFIPGTDSGTFDYFVEEVFDEDQEPILASNPQLSEDDNVLVQGITGSPYAVGFFGYAYYQENADALKILSLEGIEASAENVDNGSYPLARPLFLYSDASIIQDKPQVAAFLNFFLSNVNEEIGAVGYFPANQAVLDGARAALADALP